jgi:hypothetical protein
VVVAASTSIYLYLNTLWCFYKALHKPRIAGCDSVLENHSPLVEATEIVALFATHGTLALFRSHSSRSSAPYSPTTINVTPGASQRGAEWGYEMTMDENTPTGLP